MDAGSLVVLPGWVPENRLISAGKSHQKPSEEISLLLISLILEMRKLNFSSLKKLKNFLSCLSRKFPNYQPKAQLGQERAGNFCPLSWWCLSKCKQPGARWLKSGGSQPIHVPRGGARINVSGLAKNYLFCWQVYFIAFLMVVSSIPIHHRNEINSWKPSQKNLIFCNLLQPNQGPFPTVPS